VEECEFEPWVTRVVLFHVLIFLLKEEKPRNSRDPLRNQKGSLEATEM